MTTHNDYDYDDYLDDPCGDDGERLSEADKALVDAAVEAMRRERSLGQEYLSKMVAPRLLTAADQAAIIKLNERKH